MPNDTETLAAHYRPILQRFLTDDSLDADRADKAVRAVFEMMDRCPMPLDPMARDLLEDGLRLIQHAEAVEAVRDLATVAHGKALSMLGRMQEAVELTEREAERRPTVMTATAAAMARRRAGDPEGALRWLRLGADLDKSNETCLLDLGDTCIELGDFRRALASYEEALGRVNKHPWAYPSAVYCRYRIDGAPEALEELRYMANAGPCTCGLGSLLGQIFGGFSYEDQRLRAEALMKEIDPDFVPQHRPHEHEEEED